MSKTRKRTGEERTKGYSLIVIWFGGFGIGAVIAAISGGWDTLFWFFGFWILAGVYLPTKSGKRVHYLMGLTTWIVPWIIATVSLAVWLTSPMKELWSTSQAAFLLLLLCQIPFLFIRVLTIPGEVGFWGKERDSLVALR